MTQKSTLLTNSIILTIYAIKPNNRFYWNMVPRHINDTTETKFCQIEKRQRNQQKLRRQKQLPHRARPTFPIPRKWRSWRTRRACEPLFPPPASPPPRQQPKASCELWTRPGGGTNNRKTSERE